MTLNTDDTQKIKNAAPMQVTTAFSSLRPFTDRRFKKWLDNSNRYRADTITNIDTDVRSHGVVANDMIDYIAASGVPHCYDGWKYLGAAIHTSLAGDSDVARHTAYYAELRASMALLATQGIGIFNDKHYSIDAKGNVIRFTNLGKTHVAAWELLHVWSQEKSHDAMKFFRLHSKTLDEWVDAYFALTHRQNSRARSLFVQKWVQAWGVDLANISADVRSRNESSYRPVDLNRRNPAKTRQVIETISELWHLSEPQRGSSNFQALDMYLIRRALRMLHKNDHMDLTSAAGKSTYRKNVDQIYKDMFGKGHYDVTRRYMRSTSARDPIIIQLADKNKGSSTNDLCAADHHLSVISRAYLLLRMATGAVEQQLRQSGRSTADIAFWWEKIGEAHGLWDFGNKPAHLRDLWADVQNPLEDLRNARTELTTYPKINERQNARVENGISIYVLTQCHRMGLWGISL